MPKDSFCQHKPLQGLCIALLYRARTHVSWARQAPAAHHPQHITRPDSQYKQEKPSAVGFLEARTRAGPTKPAQQPRVSLWPWPSMVAQVLSSMPSESTKAKRLPRVQQGWAHFLGSQRRGSATSSVRSYLTSTSLISFFACSSTSAQTRTANFFQIACRHHHSSAHAHGNRVWPLAQIVKLTAVLSAQHYRPLQATHTASHQQSEGANSTSIGAHFW